MIVSSRPATVAEYFAGIGLVRMGLSAFGWEVVFANDIAPEKYLMYKGFFPDADRHYRIGDVFELDPLEIPPTLLATCSFPCIDLSLAGNRTGINGKHSSAFWGFQRILERQGDRRPPIILVENVPGWLSSNGGADFRLTVQSLNALGYTCDVFTLDALRFTPQSRLRVFLVAAMVDDLNRRGGVDMTRPRSLLPDPLRVSVAANADLRWFHLDLPEPPPLSNSGLSEIVERLQEDDARWWSQYETKRHMAMMSEAHRAKVTSLVNGERTTYRTFYRRVRMGRQRAEVRDDELSGCLRTAVGGSGKQFLIECGNGSIRMRQMTAREYARLQGVPDFYDIAADGVKALTGFGDAVCVPAISWVAEHALNPLARRFVAWESRGVPVTCRTI